MVEFVLCLLVLLCMSLHSILQSLFFFLCGWICRCLSIMFTNGCFANMLLFASSPRPGALLIEIGLLSRSPSPVFLFFFIFFAVLLLYRDLFYVIFSMVWCILSCVFIVICTCSMAVRCGSLNCLCMWRYSILISLDRLFVSCWSFRSYFPIHQVFPTQLKNFFL